jgi:hypothetical protein
MRIVGEMRLKKVKVRCPLVKYAFVENGEIIGYLMDNENLLKFIPSPVMIEGSFII